MIEPIKPFEVVDFGNHCYVVAIRKPMFTMYTSSRVYPTRDIALQRFWRHLGAM